MLIQDLTPVTHMPAAGEDEKEAARVFSVAATRATQRLVLGWVGMETFRNDCLLDKVTPIFSQGLLLRTPNGHSVNL
jgi:hypothetical protein